MMNDARIAKFNGKKFGDRNLFIILAVIRTVVIFSSVRII